jgi:hypothetical protein
MFTITAVEASELNLGMFSDLGWKLSWSIISSYPENYSEGTGEYFEEKLNHSNISLGLDYHKRSLKVIQRETCEGRGPKHFTSTFMNT